MLDFADRKYRPIMIEKGMIIIIARDSILLAQGRPSNQLEIPEERDKIIAKSVIDKKNLRFCLFI